MPDYHLSLCVYTHSEKIKTNLRCASQICIGVDLIIVLSLKMQSLCDILIGPELNEITPTAGGKVLSTTGLFMTNHGATD